MSTSDRRIAAKAARLAAPVFADEEWAWDNPLRPPGEGEIAIALADLIASVRRDPAITMSRTGRFRVVQENREGEEPELYVCLELATDFEGAE